MAVKVRRAFIVALHTTRICIDEVIHTPQDLLSSGEARQITMSVYLGITGTGSAGFVDESANLE